ncbi:MAG: 4a-hydroxytetrahydrobiopterin dehydratase [Chloroflexota bacterium]
MTYADADVRARLAALPGWDYDGRDIVRTVECAGFLAAVALIDTVAEAAQAADHHPDIDLRYNRVRFALHTHSEGGITDRDLALAGRINQLATV